MRPSILLLLFFSPLAGHAQKAKVPFKSGIFVHYLFGLQNTKEPWNMGKVTAWDACVNEFNTELFAGQVKETGADYVIFTLQQIDRYFCIPSVTYEKRTGYARGAATSNRDLVNDLSKSLAKRGIRLFLYTTGDGPRADAQASKGLNNPTSRSKGDFKVDREWVVSWSQVLTEISKRYGARVSGWWVDGCYDFIGYNRELLAILRNSLLAGNKNALIGLNNSPKPKVTPYLLENYTSGESDSFSDYPPQNVKFQWHVLSYLGKTWANPGTRYTAKYMAAYIKKVNSRKGMVSIDVCVLRNGNIDAEQLALLKRARQPALK